MFQSLSWHQYWTGVIVASCIYYALVYLFYSRGTKIFGKETVSSLHASMQAEGMERHEAPTQSDNSEHTTGDVDPAEQELYNCLDELNAFFENGRKSKPVKGVLVQSIRTILQKYPSLAGSVYKDSITNVIAVQCENICSIHLSAAELEGVWFGL